MSRPSHRATHLPHRVKSFAGKLLFATSVCLTAQISTFSAAQADTVVIPLGNQAPEMQTANRPQKGQSTESVRQQFGTPLKQTPAVGDPPISRWTFADFVVYFESGSVVHTVLKHRPPANLPQTSSPPTLKKMPQSATQPPEITPIEPVYQQEYEVFKLP